MNSNIKTKIKKNLPLYESLKKLPKEALKHVIEHLDDDSIDAICECVYNVVHTNLNMSKKKKSTLKKNLHAHCCLKNLKRISNSKLSVSKRRKALMQEGQGIGLILSAIVPLLTKLFMK